jgi:dipeptidyl aminopeptidase/acylaminoacyl peptidase
MANRQGGISTMAKRYFTPEDLLDHHWLSGLTVHSDSTIAYVDRSINKETNSYYTTIKTISNSIIETIPGDGFDSFPSWSPDGTLTFLRGKEKKAIWMQDAQGNMAQLLDYPASILSYQWSPDGSHLLFTAAIHADPAKQVNPDNFGHVYEQVYFKQEGTGFYSGTYTHLFLFRVADNSIAQLTDGAFHVKNAQWLPDGKQIAFTAGSLSGKDAYNRRDKQIQDLYTIAIQDCAITKKSDSSLSIQKFTYNADEQTFMLIANNQAFGSGTSERLYRLGTSGTPELFHTEDMHIGSASLNDAKFSDAYTAPIVHPVSKAIYALVTKHGQVHIHRFAGDAPIQVTPGEKDIYDATISADGRYLIYAALTPTSLSEIYQLDLETMTEEQLTNCHTAFHEATWQSIPEEFWFTSFDGTKLQGWMMPPAEITLGKVPLILQIHGGPHSAYTNMYSYEFQALTAQGYAVLFLNPRGSVGYDQALTQACRGDFGNGDYRDIMSGLTYAQNTYPFVDQSRIGVAGGSYGGLMTNWIIGQTNKFKAAVSQRCISNWVSFYNTSDIGIAYTEGIVGGNIWENSDRLWERSPIAHVQDIETPLLLIHGEADLRCPVSQADELYTALKRWDKTTKLIRYPASNHTLLKSGKPSYRVDLLEQVTSWMNQYV